MSRTLLVTNDFPPRSGGIQNFVHALAIRQPAGSLVVLAPSYDGDREFDAAQPFPVIRRAFMAVPTGALAREVIRLARAYDCSTVWFGAALPLALLAPKLRRAGIGRIVAQTHGHEAAWSRLPIARSMLRRIADGCDVVTFLGDFTHRRLKPLMGGRTELVRMPPGVDTDFFRPDAGGLVVRAHYGLRDRPVIVCVSRLVRRKGQDQLIKSLPLVRAAVPEVALLLVSGGADAPRLRRLATRIGVADAVFFAGEVERGELAAHYSAGDVFAMPCRTRLGGLNIEGLGMVYLEASAAGLPVVGGDSGGAPDAVRDGITGFVVDGRSVAEIADRLVTLLTDRALARRMGAAGRAWAETDWRWDDLAARMAGLLDPPKGGLTNPS